LHAGRADAGIIGAMRGRPALIAGMLAAAAALPFVAHAQTPSPDETGAGFFKDTIVKDAKTTSAIKKLLTSKGGFVDPASQYGDLTGDGKADAVVRVDSGGAAGAMAVYVFTAEGSVSGKLRIAYRNQHRYRVTVKVANGSLTLSEPVWTKGDDACCPRKLRLQDYVWNARAKTMRAHGPARDVNVTP
jgi:hypothetical protein